MMEYGTPDGGLGVFRFLAFALVAWFAYLWWDANASRRRRDRGAPQPGKPEAKPAPAAASPKPAPKPAAKPAAARAEPAPEPEPAPQETAAAEEPPTPQMPATLFETAPERVDDLKKIRGIGTKMAKLLNERGVYQYDQLAAMSPAEVAWLDQALEFFPGRISRDGWVAQARALAAKRDAGG